MSKMSKAIAVLGVAAGLGVAAMPLSSYAAIPDNAYTTTTQAQVEVVVDGAVSITSSALNAPIKLGSILPGALSAKSSDVTVTVSSNDAQEYDLYIHALNNGQMTGQDNGGTIPNVAPAKNVSGWGYAYSATAFATDATPAFDKLPTEATKVNTGAKLTTSKDPGAGDDVQATGVSHFVFQASAATTQTADTYTGTVVFTAVVE